MPIKVTQLRTPHSCNYHTSPMQYNHTALETNSTKHCAQLGLGLLHGLGILDLVVLSHISI